MKLPLQPQLRFTRQIDAVTSTLNSFKFSAGITNGMVEVGDSPFTVNRPIFNTEIDASEDPVGASDKGRGVYYWRAPSPSGYLYTVVDTVVYYGNTVFLATTGATLATGHNKVYMFEVGSNLVIIDPEGNAGYYITLAAPTVVATITDLDFPPNQTPTLQLARGGDVLKGRAYVMDTDGKIWNSASEDPTSWNALDFIEAEARVDGGTHLAKYNNELVAFGEETIEYFYHAANPTASPLSPRLDVFHDIGCYAFDTVAKANNKIFFVGQNEGAGLGVYELVGHTVTKISNTDLDAYLTSISADSDGFGLRVYGSSLVAHGRGLYLLSIDYTTSMETYVYDDYAKFWYKWDYDEVSIEGIPVVGTTFYKLAGEETVVARMVLKNGDIISTENKYREVTLSGTNNQPVAFTILTGNKSFETRKQKFMSNVSIDAFITHADTEQSTQTAQVKFYDEGEIDTSVPVEHEVELMHRYVGGAGNSNTIARAGSFIQRNFEVTIPTDANVTRTEVYALDFDLRVGL